MCGLVAVISKQQSGFMYKDKTLFMQMLISDMFRGMDSTGVFGVNRHGNLDMCKDASPASFFLNKKDSNKFFDNVISDYHIMVGHNRKATMGGVTSETAHPFIEEDICLVHNGTLTNHKKLADTVVDSHAVCHHINAHGYKSALRNIEGAYALIWYDASNKTLYFCRNSERPLHLVETADRIYLASEEKMLDWLLSRNDVSKYTIQSVPTDKVFKFSMDTRKLECESKPKKASPPQSKQHQHHSQQSVGNHYQSMGCGHLALAYSSPTSSKIQHPDIETYKSGENLVWKITDFDMGEKSCKLVGEACDEFQTDVNMHLDLKIWNQQAIDILINNEYVQGRISSISQKKGRVQIWMSSVTIADRKWTSANGVEVTPKEFDAAGGACFTCGTVIDKEEDVKASDITVNHKGNITFIQCEFCHDANSLFNRTGGC